MQAGTIRQKGGLSVIRKGISRRWFINTIGIVFVILTVSIVTLSLMVQSSAYNGIELVLTGRVDELLNMLSGLSLIHIFGCCVVLDVLCNRDIRIQLHELIDYAIHIFFNFRLLLIGQCRTEK